MTPLEIELWLAELRLARVQLYFEAGMVMTQAEYFLQEWACDLAWDGRHLREPAKWAPNLETYPH